MHRRRAAVAGRLALASPPRCFALLCTVAERIQSVVRQCDTLARISALGVEVVAEGVENAQELDYLKRHSAIRLVQGYHLGKPAFLHEAAGALSAA